MWCAWLRLCWHVVCAVAIVLACGVRSRGFWVEVEPFGTQQHHPNSKHNAYLCMGKLCLANALDKPDFVLGEGDLAVVVLVVDCAPPLGTVIAGK